MLMPEHQTAGSVEREMTAGSVHLAESLERGLLGSGGNNHRIKITSN